MGNHQHHDTQQQFSKFLNNQTAFLYFTAGRMAGRVIGA